MTVSAGAHAPDAMVFKAPRQPVRLSELYGNTTVLLFFPMAFSSTCTEELCTMSSDLARYESLGANVYGISVDSPYVNQRYAKDYDVKFPILSDFNKEATAAFGVLSDLGDLRGVSRRSAFVIDDTGVVRYSWLSDNPGDLPPFAELERAVQTIHA
jgi:peroxiredoxin